MSTRNTRNTQTAHHNTDDIEVSNLDTRPYKQNKWLHFVRKQYKWIISAAITLALLALLALLISPLLPTQPSLQTAHVVDQRQEQKQLKPATLQPLTKNTQNIIGLNGNILCVSDNAGNNIYGLQYNSGKIIWQYHETHATLETVDKNQRLYLAEQDGANATIRMLNLDNGKTLWQQAFPRLTIASLTVEDTALYMTTQKNALYVLQNSDGTPLWHYDFPPNTSYTQADGVTLVYTEDGRSIWALQARTGKLLWHLAEHTSSWPLTASAGITFLQTQDGYLKALSSQNGHQMWQSSIITVADNPVKIVDTIGYINTGTGMIKAVHITDGRTLWQYRAAKPIQGEVILIGHILYATSIDGMVYALDSSTGRLLWQHHVDNLTSDFVIAGTSLYIHASDGSEYALNAMTGKQLWTRNLVQPDIYRTAVLSSSHKMYLLIIGADQTLTALDGSNGMLLWKQPIIDYPLFSGGAIYANGWDGSINALDLHTGMPVWYVPVTR